MHAYDSLCLPTTFDPVGPASSISVCTVSCAQVVIEGLFEHSGKGHIWIDNVHMSASTPLEECTRKSAHLEPLGTSSSVHSRIHSLVPMLPPSLFTSLHLSFSFFLSLFFCTFSFPVVSCLLVNPSCPLSSRPFPSAQSFSSFSLYLTPSFKLKPLS